MNKNQLNVEKMIQVMRDATGEIQALRKMVADKEKELDEYAKTMSWQRETIENLSNLNSENMTNTLPDGLYLFSSEKCSPCKTVDQLLIKSKINFSKLNVIEYPRLVTAWDIKSVPVLVRVINNIPVGAIAGFDNPKQYIQKVRQLLAG